MTTDSATREQIRREIEISPFTFEDAEAVAALIGGMDDSAPATSSVRDGSAGYYRWMYLDNPAGPAVARVARHRGRLVGNFAIAPKRFSVEGEPVVIGKTMDMFTHPEYQGLGLMGRLAQSVFEGAREAGMDTWYVTPSASSYPIFMNK